MHRHITILIHGRHDPASICKGLGELTLEENTFVQGCNSTYAGRNYQMFRWVPEHIKAKSSAQNTYWTYRRKNATFFF